jgi:hypothetical protein
MRQRSNSPTSLPGKTGIVTRQQLMRLGLGERAIYHRLGRRSRRSGV